MGMLNNAKISTKVVSLLVLLGCITLAIAWFGSSKIASVDASYTHLTDQKLAGTMFRSRGNTRMNAMMYDGYKIATVGANSEEGRKTLAKFQDDADKIAADLERAKVANPSAIVELEETLRGMQQVRDLVERANQLSAQNRAGEAIAVLKQADAVMAPVFGKSLTLVDRNSDQAAVASDELSAVSKATINLLYLVAIIAIVAGVGLAVLITRIGITGPLNRLQAQMGDIAGGSYAKDVEGTDRADEVGAMANAVRVFRENGIAKDAADAEKVEADKTVQMVVETLGASLSDLSSRDLTTRVDAEYPGLYAVLKDNYNEAISSVRTTIEQVSESARTISTGTAEIAQASEDLARRTESNAASLEETSAALTQIEGRLKATATASQSTVARADQALATVDSGRTTADTAMQAMGRVSGSAKGIDDVIEGLDKIAFQTRVLAMNAAVEAGRAGDAGRGFAVVADLVSALAMRAEEEAKRARDQLSVTQAEIVTAVEAVGKVDSALADILSDVSEVNNLLAGMASDNQAQSSAITQITAAVSSMDQATQQNAAMVEETSAAARNLTQEVGNLANAAAQFNVGGGDTQRTPIARLASPAANLTSSVPTAPRHPTPKLKAVPSVRVNVHARSKAVNSEWSEF
jgi:methyl-accepting chemotaxis protein